MLHSYTFLYTTKPSHKLYPFITVTGTLKQGAHKHNSRLHRQQKESRIISLKIRIERLLHNSSVYFMALQFTLFIIVLFVLLFFILLPVSEGQSVNMQQLLYLPVNNCTHVQADIFKGSHGAFLHCVQISRMIIHQDGLHASLK